MAGFDEITPQAGEYYGECWGVLAAGGRLHPGKKEGRTYSRPPTGTAKSPRKDAFDAPQVGAASMRFSCPRKLAVSLGTAAEATRKGYVVSWDCGYGRGVVEVSVGSRGPMNRGTTQSP